jgi:hypothetical protein
MGIMDVFNQAPFRQITMTEPIEHLPYTPQMLGSMGIFRERGIRTTQVAVEDRSGILALVPVSPRGAPPDTLNITKRHIRSFSTLRLAKYDRIMADEVQDVIGFGTMDGQALKSLMTEIAERQAMIRNDIELTHEHMRLGAVQGILVDADGTTVLANWFDEFGVSQPAEIGFDLTAASPDPGILRQRAHDLMRAMVRASTGSITPNSRIVGLCGDTFYDQLLRHAEVREQALAIEALGRRLSDNAVWQTFTYGGIDFINYRGTDDNSLVAIPDAECKFFPMGTDIFEVVWGPGESESTVNRPGQPVFARIEPEQARDPRWTDIELYSYPLFICKKPAVLFTARAGA